MYVLYVYLILKINKMILYKWIIVHMFFINHVFNNGLIHLIYVLYVKLYKMYNDLRVLPTVSSIFDAITSTK